MPTLTTNKRLHFDYEILEDYEAGIILTGAEVKACKRGMANLTGAYASVQGGEIWLKNAQINAYQMNNQRGYQPIHDRKLLLRRKIITELISKLNTAGLTLLVESLYTTRGFVKAKLVLARGKKAADKRAKMKKRDVDRSIARALRQKY
ncbi:MAG: SsrA-binding protein SmpB [Patescibacteria group bacterium]|jgi:SsrA-binding protein